MEPNDSGICLTQAPLRGVRLMTVQAYDFLRGCPWALCL